VPVNPRENSRVIVAITLRRDEPLDVKKHTYPGLFATI
jgi:hypothetical protein